DLAKRAVELNQTSISTVEHGFFGDQFEYYEVAEKYGLKMVFGVEFYYVKDRFEKDRTNAHVLILARNMEGRRQIIKLVTEANITEYYYKTRIDNELLIFLNPKDVVVTTACVASPYNLYKDEGFIVDCKKHFGDNFYLEIHDDVDDTQIEYN